MLSLKRRLLSGSAWVFAGRGITALTGLLINAMLARILTPEELGTYFLAFSMVNIGVVFGKLGLHTAVVRLIAESITLNHFNQVRQLVSIVFKFGLLGSAVVGAIYYLFLGKFIGSTIFHAPAMISLNGLIAGWIVVETLQGLISESFRGLDNIRLATVFGGLVKSILLCFSLFLLYLVYKEPSIPIVMLLAMGSGATSTLVAGWFLRSSIMTLPTNEIKQPLNYKAMFGLAWPLFLISIANSMLGLADIWVAGAFLRQEDVGVYGAVLRLVSTVALPLLLANLVVPPLIVKMYIKGLKKELEQLLRTTATIVGIPAFILLVSFLLWGGPILALIYGESYRNGAMVLGLLSIGRLVNVAAGSCGMVLIHTGHQKVMTVITLLCSLFSVGFGIIGAKHYGLSGLAAAFASMLIVQNILMLYYARTKAEILTLIKFRISKVGG